MQLLKFRVTGFRSIVDSGWIEADSVSALIGTNESGKTNLLVPLWKLKPAKDGEINALADYPRKRYGEIRSMEKKPIFIQAYFELEDALIREIAKIPNIETEDIHIALVSRDFDGEYHIEFPEANPLRSVPVSSITEIVSKASLGIEASETSKNEAQVKDEMLNVLNSVLSHLSEVHEIADKNVLSEVLGMLRSVNIENPPKRSTIVPLFGQLLDEIDDYLVAISRPSPSTSKEAKDLVVKNLPSFVYYSNYGNLDSEIYLPHVIQNLARKDLGSREEAKVRTLKVLFEFVRLNAQEILELGHDFDIKQRQPTDDEIKAIAQKKKERDVLLQSASVELTGKFRNWWKQGDYRFRFQADGDHFRIWVSDDRRPEEIELEGRSTGLQWFLSFYLVFLVESKEAHKGAILLLDEAGLSLHPLAQRDLSDFFKNLSKTNQIIYTTHSPFLVDHDNLDRVHVVYVNDQGATEVSKNLRAGDANPAQSRSIYAVHAALGLSVSDVILQGCKPIIVEGPADQMYLSAIKNHLISKGLITPKREIVFVPAGGVRGVSAVASILTSKDEALPYIVVDSDASGLDLKKKLINGIYKQIPNRIIEMQTICGIEQSEVEDLMPVEFLADIITRYIREPEEAFSEIVVKGQPIVPQVEQYAEKYGIELSVGWKPDVARLAKMRLQRDNTVTDNSNCVTMWKKLFDRFEDIVEGP